MKLNAEWHQNGVQCCPCEECNGLLLSSIYFYEMKCSKCKKYFMQVTKLVEVDRPEDEK